jgi:predicted DsbA family dithiol-disulfide isomerase
MRNYFSVIIYSMVLLCGSLTCFATPIAINSNNKNKVTLIEYYDYECPHCRRMESVIEHLQAKYPNLQIIYRVTPVINSRSRDIASFALATKSQGQWRMVHQALMQLSHAPTWFDVNRMIAELKLNKKLLFKTMKQIKIQQEINRNIKEAEAHAIRGGIYLPMLIFKSSSKKQVITLLGEQPYTLLSAVVQQLSSKAHVSLAKKTK